MVRYFMLDDQDRPRLIGTGPNARARYQAWLAEPGVEARRVRLHTMIGESTLTLEFDGAVTGMDAAHRVKCWVVRLTTPSRVGPLISIRDMERRIGIQPAMIAFRITAERLRAQLAQRDESLRRSEESIRQSGGILPPRGLFAAEITTDLIGTPIHPQGAVPVFDDEHGRDEDI